MTETVKEKVKVKVKVTETVKGCVKPVSVNDEPTVTETVKVLLLQPLFLQDNFNTPVCPVYQNVDGKPHTDPAEIKANLIAQLTSCVRWTQSVQNMIADGADDFTECGPGKALKGMISKINGDVSVRGLADLEN